MLKIENIKKSYDRVLFNNLNITFPNKGFFLIIGESGRGKTTLLNIILGIEVPDEGNVIYNNKVLKKDDFLSFRRSEISYVFQDYGLIDYYTIKQNLTLPLISIKNNIKDIDLINALKKVGINKNLNTICKNLSGGEKQRIAIARALLSAEERTIYFARFNVDGLLRGDYKSRMEGYAVGRQNGWLSTNDIRKLEDLPLVPTELGGDDYLVNGNMIPIRKIDKEEDTNEE